MFRAMQHVPAALVDVVLSSRIKVTMVLDTDMYECRKGKLLDDALQYDVHGRPDGGHRSVPHSQQHAGRTQEVLFP